VDHAQDGIEHCPGLIYPTNDDNDFGALAQSKKSEDREYDDDGADDVDNAVHDGIPFTLFK